MMNNPSFDRALNLFLDATADAEVCACVTVYARDVIVTKQKKVIICGNGWMECFESITSAKKAYPVPSQNLTPFGGGGGGGGAAKVVRGINTGHVYGGAP